MELHFIVVALSQMGLTCLPQFKSIHKHMLIEKNTNYKNDTPVQCTLLSNLI